MLNKIKNHWWLPIAALGVTLLWALGALFGMAHAYVLAGGDNPLMLLEGKALPLNGVALGVGLASVGSDCVKAVSGFLLVGALTNKALRWPARTMAVLVALTLCIPTLVWSIRSSVGFASLAFGDTIAGRGNEKIVSQALMARIEQGQARLGWLERQTSDRSSVRTANAREATELRSELRASRTELRSSKAIGAADPGGQTLSSVLGIPVDKISTWTPFLLILVVEAASIFGWPAIAMATAVGKALPAAPELRQTQTNVISGDFSGGKPRESQGDSDTPKTSSQTNSFLPARTLFERLRKDMTDAPPNGDTTSDVETPQTERKKPAGRPKNAKRQDGHMEAFVDLCRERGEKPKRKTYVRFCKDEHIGPLNSGEYHYALKLLRLRHLPPKAVARYFDTQPGNAMAH